VIVLLFEPSQNTLEYARETRQLEPLDLDEVEAGHDH